jgi:gluconokinase
MMIVVVMGVSGVGKTTLGRRLADCLGWAFIDADDFHSSASIEKMRSHIPLADTDRFPWLRRLHAELERAIARGDSVVLACSALKASGRSVLAEGLPDVRFVLIQGDPELIKDRMRRRKHFMPSRLLASQLADLEPPGDGVVVPLDLPTELQVSLVRWALLLE